MITVANEFETIPAYTHIAGQSDGSESPRETACELLKAYDLITSQSYSSIKYWQDIAISNDDDDYLLTVQQDIADMINDQAPLPDYCTVTLHDSEWLVLPNLENAKEDCLTVNDHAPNELAYDDDKQPAHTILVVNDHGNVTCMQWEPNFDEYREIWSMV